MSKTYPQYDIHLNDTISGDRDSVSLFGEDGTEKPFNVFLYDSYEDQLANRVGENKKLGLKPKSTNFRQDVCGSEAVPVKIIVEFCEKKQLNVLYSFQKLKLLRNEHAGQISLKEYSNSQISKYLEISRPTWYRHKKILISRGLIIQRQKSLYVRGLNSFGKLLDYIKTYRVAYVGAKQLESLNDFKSFCLSVIEDSSVLWWSRTQKDMVNTSSLIDFYCPQGVGLSREQKNALKELKTTLNKNLKNSQWNRKQCYTYVKQNSYQILKKKVKTLTESGNLNSKTSCAKPVSLNYTAKFAGITKATISKYRKNKISLGTYTSVANVLEKMDSDDIYHINRKFVSTKVESLHDYNSNLEYTFNNKHYKILTCSNTYIDIYQSIKINSNCINRVYRDI